MNFLSSSPSDFPALNIIYTPPNPLHLPLILFTADHQQLNPILVNPLKKHKRIQQWKENKSQWIKNEEWETKKKKKGSSTGRRD